jgi:nucleotidyltransferase substrate binding protein (TIGR01987 family)
MSSKYEELLKQLNDAILRFDEIMREKKSIIVRDSAIQRFEFTFELSWKALRTYLIEKKGARDLHFPKDTFKSAFQAGIIENDPAWLEMVDTRNATSHMYKESMAEEVYNKLPKYLPLLKKLAAGLS